MDELQNEHSFFLYSPPHIYIYNPDRDPNHNLGMDIVMFYTFGYDRKLANEFAFKLRFIVTGIRHGIKLREKYM